MKIAYFGTPKHSAQLLREIAERTDHEISLVVTNPDRPQGRSKQLKPSPVKDVALEKGFEIYQPDNLRDTNTLDFFRSRNWDLFLVFAYGSIFPKELLEIPRFGCINVHGSLLPELRGASPVQTAIWKGYQKTGVTIQYMAEKMDSGDIISQSECSIDPSDNTESLMQKITDLGIQEILKLLAQDVSDRFPSTPQDHSKATYCSKLKSEDRPLNFSENAVDLEHKIRAFAPDFCCYATFRGKRLVLVSAKKYASIDPFGSEGCLKLIDNQTLLGQCGNQTALQLLTVQPESKKPLDIKDFINGYRPKSGEMLE